VLKGGLPYTLLIELLGTATPIRHVMCGRASGSHIAPEYVVRPLDFEWGDMAGSRIVVVDNNAATGATLAHLARDLRGIRSDLFLDYVVTAFAELDTKTFRAQGYEKLRIGPFSGQGLATGRKRHLVSAIALGLPGSDKLG
jgi:hypothetical protein